ncbi:MAG TPA: hypothetical protein VN458_00200 [Solirubrobacterales bacterium]|nr:hypothetical protein [Solirubrobacterales bacterium]
MPTHSATAEAQHQSERAEGSRDLDAETIVDNLDDETVRALGLLHRAPRGIPELAIASFDYGTRGMLEAYGVISSKRRDDRTLDVSITPLGRDVIKLSAEQMPTLKGSDLADAVRRANDLLSLAETGSVRAVSA